MSAMALKVLYWLRSNLRFLVVPKGINVIVALALIAFALGNIKTMFLTSDCKHVISSV